MGSVLSNPKPTRARLSPSRSRLCPWPLAAHASLAPNRASCRGRAQLHINLRLADENDDSDGAAKDVIRRDEVSGAADDRGGDGGAMQVEVKHGVIVSSKTENVEHV